MNKIIILLFAILSSGPLSRGQDMVFLKDKSEYLGDYRGTSGDKLIFIPEGGSKLEKINLKLVEMLITAEGQLSFYHENDISNYILPINEFEIILTKESELIRANEVVIGFSTIKFKNHLSTEIESISRENVLAIFNSTQLFVNVNKLPLQKIKKALQVYEYVNSSKLSVRENSSASESIESSNDNNLRKKGEIINSVDQIMINENLTISQVEFEAKAKDKVRILGTNLRLLISKEQLPVSRKSKIKNRTLNLFIHDSCKVQVSSNVTDKVQTIPVRVYIFSRIEYDNFEKIEVNFAEVNYVSNIRRFGNQWKGVISFVQSFKVFDSENEVVYQDITTKSVEVILVVYEDTIDGEQKYYWDVLLGNVIVEQTI